MCRRYVSDWFIQLAKPHFWRNFYVFVRFWISLLIESLYWIKLTDHLNPFVTHFYGTEQKMRIAFYFWIKIVTKWSCVRALKADKISTEYFKHLYLSTFFTVFCVTKPNFVLLSDVVHLLISYQALCAARKRKEWHFYISGPSLTTSQHLLIPSLT